MKKISVRNFLTVLSNVDGSMINFCSPDIKNDILSYFIKIRIFWEIKFYNRKISEYKENKKKVKIFNHI